MKDRNIELRVADMERTQLPDALADVLLSNCVINLCLDKDAVYKEAFRILRDGASFVFDLSALVLSRPYKLSLCICLTRIGRDRACRNNGLSAILEDPCVSRPTSIGIIEKNFFA